MALRRHPTPDAEPEKVVEWDLDKWGEKGLNQ